MRLPLVMRKIHKWIGLIVGIQLLFWVFGGLVMSAFPLEQVHGDHLVKTVNKKPVNFYELYPVVEIVQKLNVGIVKTVIIDGFSGPEYHLTDTENNLYFHNAVTGLPIKPLEKKQATEVANIFYSGEAPILNISLINKNSTEYRKRLPAWRVQFDDSESSTFYIAQDNGQLMSVRNSMWRIFDFVWMLHIMDYKNRTDFNHWLLILAAALALTIALSGIYLVVKTFRKKDFKFVLR